MSEVPALKIGKDDIASKSDRVAGDSVGVAHQTSEAKNLCSNPASISHNDPDVLQDHGEIMLKISG